MTLDNDLRIVLIGAGSVSFGLSTMGDLMTVGLDQDLTGSTIVFHDINEEALRRTYGVFQKAMDEMAEGGDPIPYKIEATSDPKEALQGANYCVMSIEHGNRVDTWKQDYYIPRKHGSKQIYGENGGPGGAFHTWRQVPPMITIEQQMEDYCPDAWLFNYSNPVPRVTWALNRASKIKTIGLCHGVMAGMVGISAILGCKLNDLDFTSAGLNHFYFFTKVNAQNSFKMPDFGPHIGRQVEVGEDLLSDIRARGITWCQNRERPLIEELLRTYGYLTYPEQSHPGEYIPWADAYCPSVKYDFEDFAKHGDEMRAHLDRTLEGKDNNYWWTHFSNERAIPIIAEIEHDSNAHERAVNLINHGAISNLPDECVVEVPVFVDKQGIHAENVGPMPKGVAQLLQHEVAVQTLVSEVAVTGDYETAIQALMADGTTPSVEIARAIFREMYSVQKHLLPQFTNVPE